MENSAITPDPADSSEMGMCEVCRQETYDGDCGLCQVCIYCDKLTAFEDQRKGGIDKGMMACAKCVEEAKNEG